MPGLGSVLSSFGTRRRPGLSVVVPAYNVEQYLAECLASVLAQSYADLEVVVVVDGATDRTYEIARDYAKADRRVRVQRQANAGLGAARNAGIRAARGAHLAFLDSDDVVPPDAYALMMDTIRRTGSDMVVGTLERDAGHRQFTMRLMRQNHRTRREAVTLDEMPLMLADVFAVNKVFRRGFWDDAGLAFPEGLRYEDQPTLTAAFLAARQFDVIPETVYLWRVRTDQSSITQRRHEVADLEDRVESKRMSTALVRRSPKAAQLLDSWYRDILPVDMWEYFRSVPGASEDYWSALVDAVREFWSEQTAPFEHTRVPAQQRFMGWLVAQGRRAELEQLIAFIDERRGDIPLELRDDHVVAQLPGVDDPASVLPSSVYVLGDHEHQWEGRITSSTWDGGQLHLEGFALILNVPTHDSPTELTGDLVPSAGAAAGWPLDIHAEPEPRATRFVGRATQDFDACGFRVSVDVVALLRTRPGAPTWRFELRRRVRQLEGAGGVSHLHAPDVDASWHDLTDAVGRPVEVRLVDHDQELVLECREA